MCEVFSNEFWTCRSPYEATQTWIGSRFQISKFFSKIFQKTNFKNFFWNFFSKFFFDFQKGSSLAHAKLMPRVPGTSNDLNLDLVVAPLIPGYQQKLRDFLKKLKISRKMKKSNSMYTYYLSQTNQMTRWYSAFNKQTAKRYAHCAMLRTMRCVSGNALRSGKCAALRAMRGIASNARYCEQCATLQVLRCGTRKLRGAMCCGAHNALCCTQSTVLYGMIAPHLIGCVVRNAAVDAQCDAVRSKRCVTRNALHYTKWLRRT